MDVQKRLGSCLNVLLARRVIWQTVRNNEGQQLQTVQTVVLRDAL